MCTLQPQLWGWVSHIQQLYKFASCTGSSLSSISTPPPVLPHRAKTPASLSHCLPVVCRNMCRPVFTSAFLHSSSSPSSPSSESAIESSPQISLSALKTTPTTTTPLVGEVDRHNGVTVDLGQLSVNVNWEEFSTLLKGMCVCVCVCERERERERESVCG